MKRPYYILRISVSVMVIASGIALTPAAAPSFEAPGCVKDCSGSKYRLRVSAGALESRVAVTECGAILVSKKGDSWRAVDTGVRSFFHDVAYHGGQFVAVGGTYLGVTGVIVTSKDGENWTIRRCGMKTVFHGITFGGGQFVAVGDRGVIVTSSEGESWRPERSGFQGKLASVAYGNGCFVAVGEDGVVITSSNGRNWLRRSAGVKNYLSRIEFDGRFVVRVHENSLVSSNGLEWVPDVRIVSAR